MPKLLQINVTANWGSTGRIVEQIGLCAMTHGWESYVAYGRMMNSSKSKLIKIGKQFDVYRHYAESKLLDNEGLASRHATRELLKVIDIIKPDVVQLHNIHDHYMNYRVLFEYLNQSNIKVVWTFHDCWAFTGHCMHFITKNCHRWKTGCHDCLMRDGILKILPDRSVRNWQLKKKLFEENKNLHIAACSQWMANFVQESFLKEKPLNIIHNGIDLSIFKPHYKRGDTFRVIAVSNVWHKAKGLFDIYKLRSLIPSEIEIMIVGLSEQQIKNLPKGIIGINRTQNVKDLAHLYSEASVLINPTYADTFPTVNIEALACGTPVITYKTGGSPEAIDENTGIVVSQGDIDSMANAIKKVKVHQLSTENCRKRAVQFFDKDKCFEKYIQLYESVL